MLTKTKSNKTEHYGERLTISMTQEAEAIELFESIS